MRLTREAFEECRERALGLLDQRAHSAGQLRGKLLARGYDDALITLVADDLVRSGLINDRDFAIAFCTERLRGSRPAGPARLKAELMRRQVPAEVVGEALRAAYDESGVAGEYESALDSGRRKWESLRSRPGGDVRKDREKLLRFLAGRGFGSEVCWRVLETVQQEAPDPS